MKYAKEYKIEIDYIELLSVAGKHNNVMIMKYLIDNQCIDITKLSSIIFEIMCINESVDCIEHLINCGYRYNVSSLSCDDFIDGLTDNNRICNLIFRLILDGTIKTDHVYQRKFFNIACKKGNLAIITECLSSEIDFSPHYKEGIRQTRNRNIIKFLQNQPKNNQHFEEI
jgi:hypothetical protein